MSSVIVYSKLDCIFCKATKELLNNLKISYEEIILDKTHDADFINELKSKYNHHTFPFILINDKFIGGFTEFNNANNTFYLQKLLNLKDENFDF